MSLLNFQEEEESEDAKRKPDGHGRSFGSGPWQKKNILDLDDLFTKSQDESNKHILGHDDLFTKSQEEDNKNFLEFDYLQRNSLPFFL